MNGFRIPIGKVVLSPLEKSAILKTLDDGILSPGPNVQAFEQAFSEKVGGDFGVMVNSGTDALRIALLAMKERYHWKDGDEVIVPALTFVATINAVLQAGLKPIFIDIEYSPSPLCGNFGEVVWKKLITEKTVCLLPVHLAGCQADMKSIRSLSNNRIRILEDACESLSPLESDVSCYSFYACHILTLGVGGMAVTKDPLLADLMRSYANHGRDPNFLGSQLHAQHFRLNQRFRFLREGYSARAMEFQGALGLARLKTLDETLRLRRFNAAQIRERLSPFKALEMPLAHYSTRHDWMLFPIIVDESLDVWRLCADLENAGIETRPLFPLLTQPYFRDLFPGESEKHPVALRVSERGFYIGCHEQLTGADIVFIGTAFEAALKNQETAPVNGKEDHVLSRLIA